MSRLTTACVLGLLAAVLSPAAAQAHSIVRVIGGELSYLSSDAVSLNSLTMSARGGEIQLRDPTVDGGTDPGPCRPGEISDDANAWIVEVFCPASRAQRVRIELGEREDSASVAVSVPVTLRGGPGADRLATAGSADAVTGDEGNDRLDAGGGADRLDGGLGIDVLDAGAGDDTVVSRDGLRDGVQCGPGSDRVQADTLDEVAADCEAVDRVPTPLPPDAGEDDDGEAPRVEAGALTRQRIGRIRLLATSSERGSIAASGFVDAAGLSLPLQSDRRRVTVAGGGVELTVRLRGRALREARRALRRGRRVVVSMRVVATDAAGNSRAVRAPRIRLRR